MRGVLSGVLATFGALAAAVALFTTGSRPTALRVLLDMLLAAGLLRLTGGQSWTEIAAVAAIVALRTLLRATLLHDFRRPTDTGRPAERLGRASGT